ncbi:unnamed protein product [Candidula unifasciata]|uniref:Uncharacterized protein n=1 Tax=Candidula unifasciata TaxID=100452 RepID=A0A8S3ZVD7_9EUPU|nr:unnamed protein product [Candidula unifasciata]
MADTCRTTWVYLTRRQILAVQNGFISPQGRHLPYNMGSSHYKADTCHLLIVVLDLWKLVSYVISDCRRYCTLFDRVKINQNERSVGQSLLSSWAQKGPIQVYIAKYNYDPFEFSPNENPEAELPLSAGDYVLIVGEMDEDGFFDGELIDGRQGLVPSNFIEKVEGKYIVDSYEDLLQFHAALLQAGHGYYIPPCPRSLCLDRQLTNSLLISWRGPDPSPGLEIQSYQVLVDGQLKTSVKAAERTKALIEGVSSNTIHRVCVRCLSNRGQSKDAQCTMVVGKGTVLFFFQRDDVYPVPSELKVSHVSPTSASLSWLPGNSNYQHSIIVNGKEVRVVKPGVFRCTLTGLTPGTLHKVTLIAKSISGALNEEKSRKWVENVSATIQFATTAAGTTEPPLNVQVESGPRVGTILLTWLPVTINSSGVCNGVVVTGYHIMADERKVHFVPGPTSDHVVLSSEDFKGHIPSQLTVRTVCKGGLESVDSEVVLLPQVLIQEMAQVPASPSLKPVVAKAGKSPSSDEPKDHDTDDEIEEAFREAQNLHKRISAVSEPYCESSSSELSDIPEVEEDLIACQDPRVSEVSSRLTNQTNYPSQVEKGSPQPAPRKLVPSAVDAGPKEFHAQKPTIGSGKLLAAPARIVPAIEIIRDSSTERGTSADEDIDDSNTPSTHSTPTNVPGKVRVPDAGISASFGDAQNPSAFRHVDQTRHKDNPELAHPSGGIVEGETVDKHRVPRTQPTISHRSQAATADSRPAPDSQNSHHKHVKPWSETSSEHRKHAAGFLPSPISPLEDAGDTDSISGEINTTVDANTVRLFIALFDYDPVTMSPNVDSIDEELPFREGQILKGESLGRLGYIPCNMVSEVQIDDPDIVEQLLQETAEKLGQTNIGKTAHSTVIDDHPDDAQLTPNGVALIPQQGPMELSFKTGDIVMIYGEMDEDGFFTGEVNGQQGLVPSNFLQPADDDGLESSSLTSAARSSFADRICLFSPQVPKIGQQLPASADSNKQSLSVNFSEIKSEGSRAGTLSPADDEKPKKKGGFLNKSKNIFKKFTR